MGRAPCCSKVGLHRGPWTTREDALLTSYIQNHGEGNWRSLPKRAGLLRCGKSCRLRWMNYLRPDIKRGNIGPEEEDLIIRLHCLLGNRWSLIAGRLPGRTDNEIKNYWNSHLSKKLKKQGFVLREGTPRPKRSGAPKKKKNNKNNDNNNDINNKLSETIQSNNIAAESIKIYAPKPTRLKPSWLMMEKSESMTGDDEKGTSDASSGTNDADFISWSHDDHVGEFDQTVGFLDPTHLDLTCDLSMQDDQSLERLYNEYSQLLQFELDMNQFVEPLMQ